MDAFYENWIKGWKVLIMWICVNLVATLFFIPVVLITVFMGVSQEIALAIGGIMGLIFMPTVTYYVFKKFYGEQ